MTITIRHEETKDHQAISDLLKLAFENIPYSSNNEHRIVKYLREHDQLKLSLVTEDNNKKIIGHIAFSLVTIEKTKQNYCALAPVAVHPNHQQKGIGSSLIKTGLSLIKKLEVKGCVLVGDPNYYSKFGFKSSSKLSSKGIPQEYLLFLPFSTPIPEGNVVFDEAFSIE